jgi:NADH dehydrogenase
VGDTFGLHLSGTLGKAAWAFVHIAFLVGWGNRFTTLIQWLWGLSGRHRGERVILSDSPIRAVSATTPDTGNPSSQDE